MHHIHKMEIVPNYLLAIRYLFVNQNNFHLHKIVDYYDKMHLCAYNFQHFQHCFLIDTPSVSHNCENHFADYTNWSSNVNASADMMNNLSSMALNLCMDHKVRTMNAFVLMVLSNVMAVVVAHTMNHSGVVHFHFRSVHLWHHNRNVDNVNLCPWHMNFANENVILTTDDNRRKHFGRNEIGDELDSSLSAVEAGVDAAVVVAVAAADDDDDDTASLYCDDSRHLDMPNYSYNNPFSI